MGAALTTPLVPVEEYLNTSYEHDVEYVDGVLVERGMPRPAHGILQGLITTLLVPLRRQYEFFVALECRVELVPRSRYRIPDVLLCQRPAPATKVLMSAPLAAIEIWSPDDRLAQQMMRFREYWERGVRQILVLDPEEYKAFRYVDGAIIDSAIDGIELPDGRIVPFSSDELFAELKSETSPE